MPRRGKGSKANKGDAKSKAAYASERNARRRVIDEKKARFWQDRIHAAVDAKRAFSSAAREVDNYFKSQHASLFNSASVKEHFMQFSGAAAVSVPKAAQIRGAMGPHLYPLNPKRNVNPKTSDMVMLALSRALSAYINRTPREGKLARNCRKVIDDSLLRGRGFMRTGYDAMQGIVTSWYVSSRDVLIDPDVDSWEEAEWIAIRKVLPIWRAKRQIKDRWRKKDLRGNYKTLASADDSIDERSKSSALTNDLLECWEVYSKMGAGMLGLDFDGKHKEEDSDFVKLTISLTHDVPLSEGEWETPLYLDKDWLVEPIDFVETLDELWPESVMSQVMPLQKSLDLLTSLSLNSCKMRAKVVVIGDEGLPEKQQRQIKYGTPSEYIPVKTKVGEKLGDKFLALNFGSAPPELVMERAFIERQFEATTGLTSAVTGAAEGQAKDRSATASRLRGQATNARLGDMRARVEEWATNVARHEALMVRLELDSEELEGYVPSDEIGMFMVSITPSDQFQSMFKVGEIPVRDQRTKEERKDDTRENYALTLEQLAPEAATFFQSEQEAGDAAMKAIQGVLDLAEVDVRAYALAQDMGVSSMDDLMAPMQHPETGEQIMVPQLPEAVTVRPVNVGDVWSATSGVTAEELCRELSYEIATGSMQKFDKTAEIELAETAFSQVLPAAINSGDYNLVNAIFKRSDDAHEVPEEKRLPPLQPPPPPQAPEGGA